MRDPEWSHVLSAATRPGSAWEQWRALPGLAVAPGQPVVSYVGYSLKEPWGEPRKAPANTRVRRFWARQYPSAAAASQRIRPGIWPAGPRVSFPAR